MAVKLLAKKIVGIAVGLGSVGVTFLLYANWVIMHDSPPIFRASDAPTSSLAIIFGGGMKNTTEMSDMQWDRVEVGAALYTTGKVSRLMITGDDGAFRGDEITAMTNRLIALGVPTSSLAVDPHGYRTYESCYREAKVYGVWGRPIFISQSFHLPRIQYLCRHFGIKGISVAADLRPYDSLWTGHGREWLARLKGWWQVTVTQPLPRTLAEN